MLAVTVINDGERPQLTLKEQAPPQAADGQVIVAVRAVSLNNGEVREALAGSDGHRPGFDYAGVVEHSPAGSALSPGDRVFGLAQGTWAERVAAPTPFLARMPDELTFEAAAALPVAGMTAAGCLLKNPRAERSRILVTASTGGVGMLAVQLGKAQGAHVTALVRDLSQSSMMHRLGSDEVLVLEDVARAAPYDLILEGAGGSLLGRALEWLSPRGVCVNFGDAAGDELTTFDARKFRMGSGAPYGGTSLYGFFLLEELMRANSMQASSLLIDLAQRVVAGTLDPVVSRVASWREADTVSRALLNREFQGKAVLIID